MGRSIYEGIGGVARKGKQPYVGVGGVARKIKEGFIGIGGIARKFFSKEIVLYDNGVTNYTWGGNVTNSNNVLSPTGKFYISESINISGCTKLGMTFIDSTTSSTATSTQNANLRLYNYNFSSTEDLFDTGFTRSAGNTITKLFDLDTDVSGNDGDINDHDLTNFRPAFLFMIWNSSWLSSTSWKGKVQKIWFE